jgi:hypothetical protein
MNFRLEIKHLILIKEHLFDLQNEQAEEWIREKLDSDEVDEYSEYQELLLTANKSKSKTDVVN